MSKTVSTGGVGTLGLLGVLFVGLKLTGYIDWSWWTVTAPFWVPTAMVIVVLILLGIALLIEKIFKI